MFQRRKPLTTLQKLREIFWPSMGWWRACIYIKHRVVRLSDTNHKIALGLAIGAGVSFSPILMTHFIQAGIIAYLLRANIIASLIGTFVGNPWTFPFIWLASINFGSYLFGMMGLPASTALPDDMSFAVIWDLIRYEPGRIFMPWMTGGYLLGFFAVFVFYPIYFNLVKAAKIARQKAREIKAHKVAKQITGQKK